MHKDAVALRKVINLVRSGEATSRAEIARRTSLARSTVSQQVDYLIARGLVTEHETNESVRGRPPRELRISPTAGTIAVADVDTAATQVAIADLTGRHIASHVLAVPVHEGPERVFTQIIDCIRQLVDTHTIGQPIRHAVTGLPAPVDVDHGSTIRSPSMPGWDGYPVAALLRDALAAPITVDNDVNLMALGETTQHHTEPPLLFIKIASGIGAGLVTANDTVYRGADGAAGDIGHIRVPDAGDHVCGCGKTGCLATIGSYRAVLRDLDIPSTPTDDPLRGSRLLADRVATGDPKALQRIRHAAASIGDVAATLVQLYNPRTLVLGGLLAELHDEILSGVRAVVYDRALPLFTRQLTITTSTLGNQAGTTGAITLALKNVFNTDGLARLLTTPAS